MSIDSPTGILDIRNATLKVSKLEVTNATGFDTALNNIARNTILLVDSTEQTASNSWALKLPNAWVGEFEGYWASGATGNIDFNFYNNTTSGTNGYTLSMDDTTIVVKYDGTTLQTTTISSTLKTDAYRKVSILFERDTISVSIDGVRELYFKDSTLRSRVYDDTAGGYITVGGLDATNRKFKNLKVVNEKWISDGTSNIACMGSIDIVGNLNLQKVSNTASIKLNSNVVTEFVRSKKLIKYPRVALTSSASNGYENGYKVTFSNESSLYLAFHAFNLDAVVNNVGWYSDNVINRYYNGTNGAYSGTTRLASETELGEWIGLEVPSPIKLYDVRIVAQSYSATANTVDDFIIYAKKQSGDTWTKLGKFTGIAARQGSSAGVTVNVNSVDYYKFFALVATKRDSQGAYGISIRALNFFGVPEYDPEAHGTDVIMRSVPNVPNTDWLEVYYDGRDYTGTPTSIVDKSGNDITATANNITIDATYNSFEFTESPKSNIIANNVSFVSGDESHSIVLWVRLKNGNASNLLFDYRVAGGTSTTGAATGLFILNTNTRLQFFHQGTDKNVDFDFVQNRWYHIAGTYTGGGGFTGSKIYIDGVDVGGVPSGSNSVLVLPATGTITIGDFLYNSSIGLGDGSIANLRLFNRALSADEVWQLYAYQKEYFDVSPDVVTFRGGRLGVGTSEPRAVLDVRGDIVGSSPVYFYLGIDSGNVSATTKIPFNKIRVNKGNGFDSSTYNFTAPVSGYYWMAFGGVNRSASTILQISLKAGSLSTDTNLLMAYDRPYGQSLMHADRSGIVYIAAGGVVSLWVTNGQVDGGNGFGNASVEWGGFLLSREFHGQN